MAATLLLDTIDGTQFNVDLGSPQLVRGGIVTGITGDPATAYDQLITACAAKGYVLGNATGAGGRTLYFRRIVGRPFNDDSVSVQLIWDTDFGASPNAYIISYSGYEQAYQTNRIPGTRVPILIPDGTVTSGNASYRIKGDLSLSTFSFPMRRVQVSGIRQGTPPPPGTYDGFIGYCNASAFLGKSTGFWKITEGGSDFYRLQGWYSFRVAATTKNLEDWSSIHTLYSSKFHTYVTIADKDEQTLQNAKYSYGIFASVPGGLRVGPYPTTEFGPIFGFTS